MIDDIPDDISKNSEGLSLSQLPDDIPTDSEGLSLSQLPDDISKNSEGLSLSQLPDEILCIILMKLRVLSQLNPVGGVCSRFRRLAKDKYVVGCVTANAYEDEPLKWFHYRRNLCGPSAWYPIYMDLQAMIRMPTPYPNIPMLPNVFHIATLDITSLPNDVLRLILGELPSLHDLEIVSRVNHRFHGLAMERNVIRAVKTKEDKVLTAVARVMNNKLIYGSITAPTKAQLGNRLYNSDNVRKSIYGRRTSEMSVSDFLPCVCSRQTGNKYYSDGKRVNKKK